MSPFFFTCVTYGCCQLLMLPSIADGSINKHGAGEHQSTWRKTRPSATLFTINPTWTGMVLHLGLHRERPASNRLAVTYRPRHYKVWRSWQWGSTCMLCLIAIWRPTHWRSTYMPNSNMAANTQRINIMLNRNMAAKALRINLYA